MSAPDAHALLSASSASRWLNCPPSARLCETLPEPESSAYAEEGRLAHALAELQLTKRYIGLGPKKYAGALKKLKESPYYAAEMDGHVQAYADLIEQIALGFPELPYVAVEQRVEYGEYAPEGFGTCDCILACGDVLHIVDFKYGKGVPVASKENPQMMLYALGAIARYRLLGPVNTVRMTICQPRIDNTSTWECAADKLLAWGEGIKPIAQTAFDGRGAYRQGDWCRFCKAKAQCRERAQQNTTALQDFAGRLPPLVSDSEVGALLEKGRYLAAWLDDLYEYALRTCLSGGEIPGFKAVEGRAMREWRDAQAAFDAARAAGVPDEMLYQRAPVTLAGLEKIMGKKPFEDALGGFVQKKPGKPTLVPSSDKREAITLKTTAKHDFGGEEHE